MPQETGPYAEQSGTGVYQLSSSCTHLAKDLSDRPKPLKFCWCKVGKGFLAPDLETTPFLQWMEAVLECDHAPQEHGSAKQPAESSNIGGPGQLGDEQGERLQLPQPEARG